MLLLGDRFETFAFATASMFNNTPIAHLHGGESAEGLHDEAMRHSISKMAQLHFVSTDIYKKDCLLWVKIEILFLTMGLLHWKI